MTNLPDNPNAFLDENGQVEDIYGNPIRPYHTRRKVEHGKTCAKVEHPENTFLHPSDLDGPYKVGHVTYCGRCHEMLA